MKRSLKENRCFCCCCCFFLGGGLSQNQSYDYRYEGSTRSTIPWDRYVHTEKKQTFANKKRRFDIFFFDDLFG